MSIAIVSGSVSSSDTSIPVTTTNGEVYSSLSQCLQGTTTNVIVVAAGQSAATFYYRNLSGEPVQSPVQAVRDSL